jgi:branched-chain amino acid transport system permease protein
VSTNKNIWILTGAVVVFLLALPMLARTDYIMNFLLLGFLYISITESWNIVGGYAGQVNIGQSAFYGLGALFMRLLWIRGAPFYLALLTGGASASVLAIILGMPGLRLKGAYFAIGTLALAVIARVTVGNILPGVSFLPGQYLAAYSLKPRYYLSLVLMLVTVATTYLVVNSRLGLGMVAIREDEEAAGSLGINTLKYKMIALVVSATLAGLAGGVYAFYQASYYYFTPFDLIWAFEPLLIAFIGGTGTIMGPVIGAIAYVALREIFAITLGEASVIVFGILFILVVLFLPGGLIEATQNARRLISVLRKI